MLALAAVGVVYFKAVRIEHPDRSTCENAVEKLYEAEGWDDQYTHHRYSLEASVESCLRLTQKGVDCITRSASQPFRCEAASNILIEDLHHGLWCYSRIVNRSETKLWAGCEFTQEKCDVSRTNAEDKAYGAKLEACTSFEKLYGVQSATRKEGHSASWFGMTPDVQECQLFWRKNADELRNVEPGCREILVSGEPGAVVPAPARPIITLGGRPSPPWCIHGSHDSPTRCYPNAQDCEAKRRDMKYAPLYECAPQPKAAFYVIGNLVEFYRDFASCKSQADALWLNGTEVTDCEILR